MRLRLPLFLTLLMVSVITVGAAASITISYTEFCSTARTDHPTGWSEKSWTVEIVNELTFNDTSQHGSIFISNSSGTKYYAVNLNLAKDGDGYSLDVYVPTKVDPGPSDWTQVIMIHNLPLGEPIYVTLSEDGKLSIYNENYHLFLDGYELGVAFPAAYIGVCGSGENVASSGQVTVEVYGYSMTPSQTVNAFIPIIVALGTLAILFRMLNRVTKF